jgi:AraC-like DNA-binding protein
MKGVITVKCFKLPIPPLPQLIKIDHCKWTAGHIHSRRQFPVFDIIFIKKGTVFLTEEETVYTLKSGEILILEPNKLHWGQGSVDDPPELYYIHFIVNSSHELLQSNNEIPWSTALRIPSNFDTSPDENQYMFLPKHMTIDFKFFLPTLEKMIYNINKFSIENALYLQTLFAQLLNQLQMTLRMKNTSRSLTLSQQIIEYLNNNYASPLTAEDFEKHFNFHRDYLSYCLKKNTGMSLIQYLQFIRIEKAKILIESSMHPLKSIAESVGLENYVYFNRLFHKYEGISPQEYRSRLT